MYSVKVINRWILLEFNFWLCPKKHEARGLFTTFPVRAVLDFDQMINDPQSNHDLVSFYCGQILISRDCMSVNNFCLKMMMKMKTICDDYDDYDDCEDDEDDLVEF